MYAANGTPESGLISGALSVTSFSANFGYRPLGVPKSALNALLFRSFQESCSAPRTISSNNEIPIFASIGELSLHAHKHPRIVRRAPRRLAIWGPCTDSLPMGNRPCPDRTERHTLSIGLIMRGRMMLR